MEVAGEDYYLDLLFYHLRLSAVDAQLRHEDDQPSIGLILCKSKKSLIVEYALKDARKPIGVAACNLTRELPAPLKGRLPSIAELERRLGGP